MNEIDPVAVVLSPGVGATMQDYGRPGWRRFGVPASGAMDEYSMGWANRLLGNPERCPVLELVYQGAEIRFLKGVWVSCCGADLGGTIEPWSAVFLEEGTIIRFSRNIQGVYSYLAVQGGWKGELRLGSCSVNARAGIGRPLQKGDFLYGAGISKKTLFPGVAKRIVSFDAQRYFHRVKVIRIFSGPQVGLFEEREVSRFVSTKWSISSRSDRSGYRLDGESITVDATIESEPTLPGSIQITPSGQPIVTLNDGPTVGGYPKIGLIHPDDLSWFVQCGPGMNVEFEWVDL